MWPLRPGTTGARLDSRWEPRVAGWQSLRLGECADFNAESGTCARPEGSVEFQFVVDKGTLHWKKELTLQQKSPGSERRLQGGPLHPRGAGGKAGRSAGARWGMQQVLTVLPMAQWGAVGGFSSDVIRNVLLGK